MNSLETVQKKDVLNPPRLSLYRSNSSLDLIATNYKIKVANFTGSHGSIDLLNLQKPPFLQQQNSVLNSEQIKPEMTSDSSKSTSSQLKEDEERVRRRVFAHYDCQSVTSNITCAARLRGILNKRRNTTTGASAASTSYNNQPILNTTTELQRDYSQSNELVLSCPFFLNEIGGEKELTLTNHHHIYNNLHRSNLARGISILQFTTGKYHCPFNNPSDDEEYLIEAKDSGATYYRKYFFQKEHENWLGMDENLGPLAISIRKEPLELSKSSHHKTTSTAITSTSTTVSNLYRVIVRSSELQTLRGSILEESIPKQNIKSAKLYSKELIEFLVPEIQLNCLRLATPLAEVQLLKLDELDDQQGLTTRHKVGIMLCKSGQSTEEEMYNNQYSTNAFNEFINLLGNKVRLKGFNKYNGGLDNKDDSTGLYTIYNQIKDCEVVFHVSTLLPFTPNNRQQLMRKRHIGNDIVTIIFQEPGALPFTPKTIRSQFQHVFVVVRCINPCTDRTQYAVSVSRSREVPLFGPPIPNGAIFNKNQQFVRFLLAKVINAENATYRSEKFTTMANRTRQEYLKDLQINYSTNIPLEPKQKFSMFARKTPYYKLFSKSQHQLPQITINSTVLKDGLSWKIIINDAKLYLAISTTVLVILDSTTPILSIPTATILSYTKLDNNNLKIYYHQGEVINLYTKSLTEMEEIIQRIKSSSSHVVETIKYSLKRNNNQLGFHVQHDGVITDVDTNSVAGINGVQIGSRIVDINGECVREIGHQHLINILLNQHNYYYGGEGDVVHITVIPGISNSSGGAVRRSCEVCTINGSATTQNTTLQMTDKLPNHLNGSGEGVDLYLHPLNNTHYNKNYYKPTNRKYGGDLRGFSPPRSSNSSGYGTGSSNKSFNSIQLSSSDKHDQVSKPPPPLPARINSPKKIILPNGENNGEEEISVKGKVTYLTDNNYKELEAEELKNDRVAALKTAFLTINKSKSTPLSYTTPVAASASASASAENVVKMRSTRSTLEEDLFKLINIDTATSSTSECNDYNNNPHLYLNVPQQTHHQQNYSTHRHSSITPPSNNYYKLLDQPRRHSFLDSSTKLTTPNTNNNAFKRDLLTPSYDKPCIVKPKKLIFLTPPPSIADNPDNNKIDIVGSDFLNLEARITNLESELRKEQKSKEILASTIANLKEENKRLVKESLNTKQELDSFKYWIQQQQ